ncbi:hypothetical protein FQR65_LT20055 [Abscondita terminalis]|nr:hypothetical protein FQR65_LT20055 [Abscondita terminalis]
MPGARPRPTDDCSGTVTVTASHQPGDVVPPGLDVWVCICGFNGLIRIPPFQRHRIVNGYLAAFISPDTLYILSQTVRRPGTVTACGLPSRNGAFFHSGPVASAANQRCKKSAANSDGKIPPARDSERRRHNGHLDHPGIEQFPDAVIEKSYNRWGILVYKRSPYANIWTTFENPPDVGRGRFTAATYFYIVILQRRKSTHRVPRLQYDPDPRKNITRHRVKNKRMKTKIFHRFSSSPAPAAIGFCGRRRKNKSSLYMFNPLLLIPPTRAAGEPYTA